MKTIPLTITGVRYVRSDYVELLTNLKGTSPILDIVRQDDEQYGSVMRCFLNSDPLGTVSRLDIARVQALMTKLGCSALDCSLVETYPQLGYLTVQVEAKEEIADVEPAANVDWKAWHWDGPTMNKLPQEKGAETMAGLLKHHLAKDLPEGASSRRHHISAIDKAVKQFMKDIRFALSYEIQKDSLEIRDLMAQHPAEEVRAMMPDLMKAINDLGSDDRIDDFQWNEWPEIKKHGEEGLVMEWREHYGVSSELNDKDIAVIREWLQDIEPLKNCEPLRGLPLGLGDEGRLFHMLIYRGIPIQVWQELRSYLILRHWAEIQVKYYEMKQSLPELAEAEPEYKKPEPKREPDPLAEKYADYMVNPKDVEDFLYNLRHAGKGDVMKVVNNMLKARKLDIDRKKIKLYEDLSEDGFFSKSLKSFYRLLE